MTLAEEVVMRTFTFLLLALLPPIVVSMTEADILQAGAIRPTIEQIEGPADDILVWDVSGTYREPVRNLRYEEYLLLDSQGALADKFGSAVSVSGDVALVGASQDDDYGHNSGSANVYRYDSGTETWIEEVKLTASDAQYHNYFGNSVSIWGNVALIGAYMDDDLGDWSGSAYIFRYDPDSGIWTEEQKVLAPDGSAGDLFGYSVSVRDDVALIGAPTDGENGTYSGSVYVFRCDQGTWTEEAKLLASDGAELDLFGCSVSTSGDIALVGAADNDDSGEGSGSAYVFRCNQGIWTEEGKILASDGDTQDYFGQSVSISGSVALIGATRDDDNGFWAGSAYVFRYDGGTGAWIEEEKLLASDGGVQDYFGHSVSIDGDVALVGAYGDEDMGRDSGSAYVFRYDAGTGNWLEEEKLLASDGHQIDFFGYSVSVSGDNVLIGAPNNDDIDSDAGSAYVFHRE
jgi:hypothetical protein